MSERNTLTFVQAAKVLSYLDAYRDLIINNRMRVDEVAKLLSEKSEIELTTTNAYRLLRKTGLKLNPAPRPRPPRPKKEAKLAEAADRIGTLESKLAEATARIGTLETRLIELEKQLHTAVAAHILTVSRTKRIMNELGLTDLESKSIKVAPSD